MITDNDKEIFLCHFPVSDWCRARHGSWHIYGHIHNKKNDVYAFMKTKERALNAAACISGYATVSFDELVRNNNMFQADKYSGSVLRQEP